MAKHPKEGIHEDVGAKDFDADRHATMANSNFRHAQLVKIAHGNASGSGDFGGRNIGARMRRATVTTGVTPRGSNLVESEPYSGEGGF